ncbi:hypothetical protein L9F63_025043, partial [Diploptera punctata]
MDLAIFLVPVTILVAVTAQDEEPPPVVQIEQGAVKGLKIVSIRQQEYYAFLGIPYAKSPEGYLRFKAPVPPEPWTGGVYDANDERSENCLFLSIFSNKLPGPNLTELMPVIVWIHGGNFVTGSNTMVMFGPDHLLTQNVVLVTINYRLGVLGFLCLPKAGIPGNNGMKDQVMALKWVKKNIANFGGDPNRVTIFGQSAGGASVHLHMMSPMTAGLFHRAISQSGTALASWAFGEPEYLTEVAFKIGSKIGCNATEEKALLQCFIEKPGRAFVNITAFEDETGVPANELKPTWENGQASQEEVFLPGRPSELIAAYKFHIVPFITGTNSKEALTFLALTKTPNFWEKFDKNFDKVVEITTGKETTNGGAGAADKIKAFYFKDKKPSPETEDNFLDCYTDLSFFMGANRVVRELSAVSTAPIYYYYFEFDGELGVAKRAVKITKPGVAHADELGYLFNTAISPEIQDGSLEQIALKRMVKMWTNFAKTGLVEHPVDDSLLPPARWAPLGGTAIANGSPISCPICSNIPNFYFIIITDISHLSGYFVLILRGRGSVSAAVGPD